MRKGGLGKGVEALLGDAIYGKYMEISLDLVVPPTLQPRMDLERDIEDLIESIKKHGVLQPILVVKESDGTYRIIAGERRWLAAKKAGLDKIPALIGDWNERERAVIALVENLQRKNLDVVEEAVYYERLVEEFGFSQEEIAELVGKSRSHISNVMRIINLPGEVKEGLKKGLISLGHAKALLSLKDEDEILKVYARIIEESMNVRDTEKLVRDLLREYRKKKNVQSRKSITLKGKYEGLKLTFISGKRKARVIVEGPHDSVNKFISELPLD
ncbi:MAG: ParB/RepB/Spo0J family partition protein [Thermosulfidibacteraceae bacterium]|jgi:ParB family chromosome partitioning protein